MMQSKGPKTQQSMLQQTAAHTSSCNTTGNQLTNSGSVGSTMTLHEKNKTFVQNALFGQPSAFFFATASVNTMIADFLNKTRISRSKTKTGSSAPSPAEAAQAEEVVEDKLDFGEFLNSNGNLKVMIIEATNLPTSKYVYLSHNNIYYY